MHTNILWRAFLLVILICTIFYSVIALYRYYIYVSLSGAARPTSMVWDIVKETESRYILETSYQFAVKDKMYEGKTVWEDDKYINEYGANEAIQDSKNTTWVVWYNPNNPESSSLEKHLPFKEIVSAIFLWGLFLYFLWLGFYVGTFRS